MDIEKPTKRKTVQWNREQLKDSILNESINILPLKADNNNHEKNVNFHLLILEFRIKQLEFIIDLKIIIKININLKKSTKSKNKSTKSNIK